MNDHNDRSSRPDLDEAGVHPNAFGFVEGMESFGRGVALLTRAVLRFLGHCLGWLLGDPRRSLIALGAAAVIALFALFVGNDGPAKPDDPPPPGFFIYTVVKDDVPNVVAKRNGVPFDVFVNDNLALFAKRAEDCQRRNVSANYLAGNLKKGNGKRRGEFCTVEVRNFVEVAVSSFHIGDKVNVRCTQATENLEACMPESLATK
ncbi:MAG: hypothetical protein NUV56_00360 [Candidatus Uhrbacteria bacterium]|nr:hypothetical protein [Candidatus Uhrbacteria bacterium]